MGTIKATDPGDEGPSNPDPCADVTCKSDEVCQPTTGDCLSKTANLCEGVDCSGHGVCEAASGSCACDPGWEGAACGGQTTDQPAPSSEYVGVPAIDFGPEIGDCRTYEPPTRPSDWPDTAVAGYYYIDSNAAAARDSDNAYGYPNLPRATIPDGPFGPGSVIELHGGPYPGETRIQALCTETEPCWLRGTPDAMPTIEGRFNLTGSSFLMVEYLDFNGGSGSCLNLGDREPVDTHHVCIMRSQCRNRLWPGANTAGIDVSPANAHKSYQIVIFDNTIENLAAEQDWSDGVDRDFHGIGIGAWQRDSDTGVEVSQWWILDNYFHRICGDGTQLTGQRIFGTKPKEVINHIYFAGNRGHANRQGLFGSKMATDVVVSQNVAWDNWVNYGHQYGPNRIWFLLNEGFHSNYGIRSSISPEGVPGFDYDASPWTAYYLGNVLYDNKNWNGICSWGMCAGSGIYLMRGESVYPAETRRYLAFNTIYDCRDGITVGMDNTPAFVWSNVISKTGDGSTEESSPVGYQILVHDASDGYAVADYDFFDDADPINIRWGGSGAIYESLAAIQSEKGQCTHCTVGAPDFVNASVDPSTRDFDLGTRSGAIGKCSLTAPDGLDPFAEFESLYGLDIRKDFLLRARVIGAVDCGAYEAE